MYKARKILISLSLLASFVGCSSSNTVEDQRKDLTAKKEQLIDEIAVLCAPMIPACFNHCTEEKKVIQCARLFISGVCGGLERNEAATIDDEFLRKTLMPDDHDTESRSEFLDILKILLGDAECAETKLETLCSIMKAPREDIDKVYGKTKSLVKVMKEIRELN